MDALLTIARYIESEGHGEIGKSIFVNEMPAGCERGLVVFTSGQGLRQHTDISGYYRGYVSVAVRAPKYQEGQTLSISVLKSMSFQGKALDGINLQFSKPEALPQSFGANEGGYIEWLLSFEISLTV
ncbi:minor capsid protein [Shewanella glacialipiscicola]|uniref:minor capsid protein n=1 Tax=Shewanella glacialipiscicola TaxID=614069 RepID=UPI003D7A2309